MLIGVIQESVTNIMEQKGREIIRFYSFLIYANLFYSFLIAILTLPKMQYRDQTLVLKPVALNFNLPTYFSLVEKRAQKNQFTLPRNKKK